MSPIRVLSLAASTAILFTACSNDADRVVVASNESTFVSILNEGDKIENAPTKTKALPISFPTPPLFCVVIPASGQR